MENLKANIGLEQVLQQKLVLSSEVTSVKENKIKRGTLVFTNGVFDLVHPGHIDYLLKARSLGDYLWIGINSDASVKRLKGSMRPINNENFRASILAAFFFVDYISIFSEDTPEQLIESISPNIHVKGGDYKKEDLPESKIVESYGGKIQIIPFLEGFSSTAIIDKIANL